MGIMTVLVKRIEMRDVEMRLYPKILLKTHKKITPPGGCVCECPDSSRKISVLA
jgi:hypothetical protein